jgi:hypothetical protein
MVINSLIIFSAYELYTATTSSTTKRDAATTESKDTTSTKSENITSTFCQNIKRIWKLTPKVSEKEMDLEKAEELCKRFKTTLSQPGVRVHFVGAW